MSKEDDLDKYIEFVKAHEQNYVLWKNDHDAYFMEIPRKKELWVLRLNFSRDRVTLDPRWDNSTATHAWSLWLDK